MFPAYLQHHLHIWWTFILNMFEPRANAAFGQWQLFNSKRFMHLLYLAADLLVSLTNLRTT